MLSLKNAVAQNKDRNQISLFGSFYTYNGSGDIPGFVMSAEYGYKFKKRIQFLPAITFTNHYEENRHFTVYNGVTYDQTLRFITSGFQAEAKAAYLLVDKKRINVKLIGGAIGRMQYDSYPSGGYAVNYPGLTGYPGILYEFYDDPRTGNKFKEFNIGYIAGPSVDYIFKNNWFISSRFLIQNDTNADFIASGFIGFGKRF
ncbi:MAG: hypothetical protein K2W79_02675 [Hydrotalea flava]|nr:hypothetical protein [Hydrotalea flava]